MRLPPYLITEWGLSAFSEDYQAETFEKICDVMMKGILVKALDRLSEGDKDDLDTFLEADPSVFRMLVL